jgi:hypothetical protein
MKSLTECVGLCKAEAPNCNSVIFMKQNLICKLVNLLNYDGTKINAAISIGLAYIQTGKLKETKISRHYKHTVPKDQLSFKINIKGSWC